MKNFAHHRTIVNRLNSSHNHMINFDKNWSHYSIQFSSYKEKYLISLSNSLQNYFLYLVVQHLRPFLDWYFEVIDAILNFQNHYLEQLIKIY